MISQVFLNHEPGEMIVCLGFIVPLEIFSLMWKRHHYRWRDENFDLCTALMTIEQWGFFSVPHLLRHGTSVYYGHFRGPVTLTPLSTKQWSCHYLFLQVRSVAAWIRAPNLSLAGLTLLPTAPPPRYGEMNHRLTGHQGNVDLKIVKPNSKLIKMKRCFVCFCVFFFRFFVPIENFF